jgi:DNA-binding NtrC family response regulator
VRELANIVERTSIVHPGAEISAAVVAGILGTSFGSGPDLLETGTVAMQPHRSLAETLDGYERRIIEAALARASGNVAEAARSLETDRPNLYRRMKRLGIDTARSSERSALTTNP